jgi:hypothetical protein
MTNLPETHFGQVFIWTKGQKDKRTISVKILVIMEGLCPYTLRKVANNFGVYQKSCIFAAD